MKRQRKLTEYKPDPVAPPRGERGLKLLGRRLYPADCASLPHAGSVD